MLVGGPYDITHEPAQPSPRTPPEEGQQQEHASLLLDLSEHQLLTEVSDVLGTKHFSHAAGHVPWPVEGVLFGPCKRPLICLPTKLGKGAWVSIVYLLDTGAPITELSPHAFEALGAESTPTAAIVSINGQRAEARLCVQGPSGNHADIPVLGADFMASVRASVQLDYGAGTFSFKAQVCSMKGCLSMHPSCSHFTGTVQDNAEGWCKTAYSSKPY